MIGQNKITSWIDNNVGSFPHFVVFVGKKGSGKKTLCKYVCSKLGLIYAPCDIKVDMVREVIDTAYMSNTKVMYCFSDADNMRSEAKNAMLKITEEPPENAYFCLTVSNEAYLLDTIKSRASVFKIQPYTIQEIDEYFLMKNSKQDRKLICDICETPYEVDLLCEYGSEFIDYVNLVIDNIAEVEPANAFKSSLKLNIKNEGGYDLGLFFKCFMKLCLKRNTGKYLRGVVVASKYLNDVDKMGINKQHLYDRFVFELREVWTY